MDDSNKKTSTENKTDDPNDDKILSESSYCLGAVITLIILIGGFILLNFLGIYKKGSYSQFSYLHLRVLFVGLVLLIGYLLKLLIDRRLKKNKDSIDEKNN